MSYWPKNNTSDGLVFIHIPKTAGLSVQAWHRQRFGKVHKAMHADVQHPHISKAMKNMQSFCVVRNPYDLCYSWYRYKEEMLNEPRHHCPDEAGAWIKGFDYWMLHYFNKINYSNDKSTQGRNPIGPSKTMLDYISVGGKVKVDHVLRFESLNEDIKQFGGPELAHTNKSRGSNNYRNAYTPASKLIVETAYAKDLEYFSYSF